MRKDRLRDDKEEVRNLNDLIDARNEHTSHFSGDIDAFEEDVEIPDDIDVDEALTFPHPKRRKSEDIDLMDTPDEDDIDDDWDTQDIQPSDYAHDYNEATNAYATDNMEEIAEEEVHEAGHMKVEDIANNNPIEIMPKKFTPDEETTE